MRFLLVIAIALTLVLPCRAQAATLQVIALQGTAQAGEAADQRALRTLRIGDALASTMRLTTEAGSAVQVKDNSDATVVLGAASEVRFGPNPRSLELVAGQVSVWSEKNDWEVVLPNTRLRGRGFVRLKFCEQQCKEGPGVYGKVDAGEVAVEYMGGRSVIRNRFFLIHSDGSRPDLLARDSGVIEAAPNFSAAVAAKQKSAAVLKQALDDFREERLEPARVALVELRKGAPGEPILVYYLGLIALQQQRSADALKYLQQYAKEDPQGAKEHEISKLLTLLTSDALQREVQSAVAQEKEVSSQPPEPGSIAVQSFSSGSSADAAVLAKGMAAMIISDLSKVPGLKVLEREKMQKISDEMHLQSSGLSDPASAVRLGRLMRAERVMISNVGVQ